MVSIYGFKVFYEEEEEKQRRAYLETIDFSTFDEDSFVDSLMNISDSRERDLKNICMQSVRNIL